tara:strand:+ start:249 stop:863 length:615 start_codon:yes stop_codon:yes gene_type:complete
MIENITDMIYVERDVLSQEKCDELIKYFWDNKDKHDDGKVEHFVNGEYQGKLANKDHKNCTQFMFEPGHKYAELMTQVIQDAYMNYRTRLPVLPAADLAILDYTIRVYPKGEGIFKTHVDQAEGGTISRLFACIIYLNDVEEGGETFFPDWNIGCKCERGKILIFPCNWIFPHGSNKNISDDKYILTAFINYNYDIPMYSGTEV